MHILSPIQADVKINKTDLNDHVKNLNTLLDIVEPNHPISFRPQIDYVDVLTFAPKLKKCQNCNKKKPNARIIDLTKNDMLQNNTIGHLAQLNNLIKTVNSSQECPPISPYSMAFLTSASPQGQNTSLDEFMEIVLPQNRSQRALAPLVTSLLPLAPHITSFMGKLLRPLIGDISNRPGVSSHKDALLQRFLTRALQGTSLANTQMEKALTSALQQRKYEVALSTLKSQEKPLDTASYLPKDVSQSTSSQMQTSTKEIFAQFTKVIDRLLKKRLLSLNHFSTSFFSALLEQLRLTLQKEHGIA